VLELHPTGALNGVTPTPCGLTPGLLLLETELVARVPFRQPRRLTRDHAPLFEPGREHRRARITPSVGMGEYPVYLYN
jgi:hypothetical protein